ncbi:MAG: hypothetical protein U0263_40505 [Polyangiaceae bacterium]
MSKLSATGPARLTTTFAWPVDFSTSIVSPPWRRVDGDILRCDVEHDGGNDVPRLMNRDQRKFELEASRQQRGRERGQACGAGACSWTLLAALALSDLDVSAPSSVGRRA